MSAKIRDNKNRWRNKTVGFRVSPEEWEEIERLVRLSGMSKQEYIMSRLENRNLVIRANPRVVKALKSDIVDLSATIKNTSHVQLDEGTSERIKSLTKILECLIK